MEIIKLKSALHQDEILSLVLFHKRYTVLRENYLDLQKSGFRISGNYSLSDDGVISSQVCPINHFRMKGLFVDFRFFYAQKEKTNFYKVCNSILSKHVEDSRFRALIRNNVNNYREVGMSKDWHGYAADDLLNYWFNGEFFHLDQEKWPKVHEVLEAMDSDTAMHVLGEIIYSRLECIRNICFVSKPIINGQMEVILPKEYA
ncbi:hypothetical protein ABRZ67_21860 [Vibrio vulnificus]|uniref:hypothetical protein n=1 Tax=Vibrio vulnificus TaxID=672 RepID=UPI002FBD3CE0